MKESIIANLQHIHQRIENACKLSGRDSSEVKLLLATKTVPPDYIRIAIQQGEIILGENKVQEGLKKHEVLKELPVEWNFIGHLQTNKIKEVLKWATCIQSVDRIDLVQKLDQRLQFEGKKVDVLLQVNTSYEESKFGVAPEKALELAQEISRYDLLNFKGLMTIGLFSDNQEEVRKCFRLLKNLQIEIQNKLGYQLPVLSMGMSGDIETAIAEGSTMLRVGTAIFGQRIYPDSHYWNEEQK